MNESKEIMMAFNKMIATLTVICAISLSKEP